MRSPTLRTWLIAILTASFAATATAQLSGRLLLGAYASPEPVEASGRRFNWELENGFKEVRPDRVDAPRELAVVLVGEGEPQPGLDRVEVSFSGGSLLPSTLVVRAGSTLHIRNEDEIAHELFAEALEGFSAEAIAPRGRRSIHLRAQGDHALRDELVPHVAGHLHIRDDLIAVAAPNPDGTFAFKQVEPGRYVLKVFHGKQEVASQAVELTGRDLTLDPITLTASSAAE